MNAIEDPALSATASAHISADLVLLRADTLRIVVPQHELGPAEYLAEPARPTGEPGQFEVLTSDGVLHRIVALSAHMTPLPEIPHERFVITSFSNLPEFLLAWNEVRILSGRHFVPTELPEVMCAPASPFRQFVEIDGALAFCCSAETLLVHAMGTQV